MRLTSWQRRRAVREGLTGEEVLAAARKRSKSTKSPSKTSEEHQLSTACADAKRASEAARHRHRHRIAAEEGDDILVAAYSRAKAAMRAFHASKQGASGDAHATNTTVAHAPTLKAALPASTSGQKRKLEAQPSKVRRRELSDDTTVPAGGASAAPGEAPPMRWTCELCNVTITVRADGRAREQHIAGKAHARNLAMSFEAAAPAPPPAAAPLAAVPPPRPPVASEDPIACYRG